MHTHTCHSITATHPQGSSHLLGYHYDIKGTQTFNMCDPYHVEASTHIKILPHPSFLRALLLLAGLVQALPGFAQRLWLAVCLIG